MEDGEEPEQLATADDTAFIDDEGAEEGEQQAASVRSGHVMPHIASEH